MTGTTLTHGIALSAPAPGFVRLPGTPVEAKGPDLYRELEIVLPVWERLRAEEDRSLAKTPHGMTVSRRL